MATSISVSWSLRRAALLLAMMLGGSADAAEPAPNPPAAAAPARAATPETWMVATSTGEIYWGTVVHDDQAPDLLTITTKSGEKVAVLRKLVAVEILAGNASGIAAENLVTKSCPGTRYASPPIREIKLTGAAPFRAEVHGTFPGRDLQVRPLPSTSTEHKFLPWADLEQVKLPVDVRDQCQPATLDGSASLGGSTTGQALKFQASDREGPGSGAVQPTPRTRSRRGPILFGVGLGAFGLSYVAQLVIVGVTHGPPQDYAPIWPPFRTAGSAFSAVQSCKNDDFLCGFVDFFYAIGGVGATVGGLMQVGGLAAAGVGIGYWRNDK